MLLRSSLRKGLFIFRKGLRVNRGSDYRGVYIVIAIHIRFNLSLVKNQKNLRNVEEFKTSENQNLQKIKKLKSLSQAFANETMQL